MTAPISTELPLYDAYVFDLDGTLYLGDDLLSGATDLVRKLRNRGIPMRFLSNNPTRNAVEYVDKLRRLGFEAKPEEVVTTVAATCEWLQENHPGAVVFPIAEQPLIEAMRDAGIRISENPEEIDIVVASYDRGFTHAKLQIAFDAIWQHKRAFLVSTNPDKYCPFPGGRGEPDCAPIVAAIEVATGSKCVATIGKPNPHIAQAALAGMGADAARTLMVGDRIETDIALGHASGMDTALVLTGDSTLQDVERAAAADRPTYVINHVGDLLAEGTPNPEQRPEQKR